MAVGRKPALDREAALARLTTLLWSEGVGRVSLDAMARELGVTKPTLCRTFGGRDEIVAAALNAYYARYGAEAEARVAAAPDLRSAVEGWLMVTAERAADPDVPRGCLMTETNPTSADDPVAAALRARSDAFLPLLHAHLPDGPEGEAILRWLLSQQTALVALSRMGADESEMRQSVRRVVDAI